jgi:hypothetical protein
MPWPPSYYLKVTFVVVSPLWLLVWLLVTLVSKKIAPKLKLLTIQLVLTACRHSSSASFTSAKGARAYKPPLDHSAKRHTYSSLESLVLTYVPGSWTTQPPGGGDPAIVRPKTSYPSVPILAARFGTSESNVTVGAWYQRLGVSTTPHQRLHRETNQRTVNVMRYGIIISKGLKGVFKVNIGVQWCAAGLRSPSADRHRLVTVRRMGSAA